MPGFPRNTQSLGASRRKAVSRYPRPTSARPRHHRGRIGRLRRVTGLAAEAAILLKAEDFVLVICDMIIAS